ncbi:hypothetical protein HLB23_39095 [Nocardia uniformis]|uniref:DUF1772 domain-containing protein n=1 Tax=Nocardia uniformis TaxID=53432 RepID=A0A849CAZ5_9NOCA|nr:hypothetical protein [Nocardia uniformis]NNH75794.1 hypothetical protein [Nocardia uniformis]
MKNYTISSVTLGIYAVVAFFVFSVAAMETLLLYPNIFRDVPESLALTEEFMSVVAVGDVMRPLGGVMMISALFATVVSIRYRIARRWLLGSLAALVSGQFLLSIGYQWPRASILFDDRGRYALAEIERAASEFLIGQYFRIAAAGLAALFAVIAALKTYRAATLAAAGADADNGIPD